MKDVKRTTLVMAKPLHDKLGLFSDLLGVPKASIHHMALATWYVIMSPHIADVRKRAVILSECEQVFQLALEKAREAA